MGLISAAEWPVHLARNAARVARGPLPAPMKKGVLRTLSSLQVRGLGARDDAPAACRILGHEVRAYTRANLALLFREVFVDLDYYFDTPSPAPFIIDCGSNIGMATLFFKILYPGARVMAFEPGPDSFEMLQRNVTANHLPGVELHQAAVGDAEGSIDFFRATAPGSVTSSTRVQRTGGVKTTVKQVRLSSLIDRDVDFLKMDIEGGEWAVMNDLVASGTLRRIQQMAIEYHHHMDGTEDRFGEFLQLLESHQFGYQLRATSEGRQRRGEFQDVLVQAYRKDAGAR